MIKGLQHMSHEERLGFYSLEKRRLQLIHGRRAKGSPPCYSVSFPKHTCLSPFSSSCTPKGPDPSLDIA
ncbi:hypothetical protein QYF61_004313 [Mycteria americana]|uniref:Uncharacterized protein n=1 Tax=Mycteria americana TaxID=33587 RepID=A0AAN7NL31_MYCAM|nr:hypothetical protein QYF61_004313 [Mycteria americana]